jgi:hypothetical protein
MGFVCASLLIFPVAAREAFAQDKTGTSGSSGGGEGADKGKHNKVDECKFEDVNDMVDKVNKESLKHGRSVGKEMDKDGNGRNDALEGKYWGTSNALGFYMCTEFSAYLQCMLQELFGCTGDQVQSIADNKHMINKLNSNMFKNPPNALTRDGWFRFEPQRTFQGGVVGPNASVTELNKYSKPQPYREGINRTNYKDLQCVSGPGMRGDGSGSGGLFGGGSAGTSAMLTSMLNSMMGRTGQNNGGAGNLGGTGDSQSSPSTEESSVATPTPTLTPTPVVTTGSDGASGTAGTPTPNTTVSATPTTPSAFDGDSSELEDRLFPGMGDSDFFRPATQSTAGVVDTEDLLPSAEYRAVVADNEPVATPTVSPYTF